MFKDKILLITGAGGFVGKNLTLELGNRGYENLLLCDVYTTEEELDSYTKSCDFVFHLAGVNRPLREEEFMEGNFGFTSKLLESLKKNGNICPVLITSSIQAAMDNPYGRSKKAGEELLLRYGGETGAKALIYRMSNVFGKWCRPNYNSAVATFCHNIAHDLPILINDRQHELRLLYIDDVVNTFIEAMEGKLLPAKDGMYYVMTVHSATLGEIADLLCSFHASRRCQTSQPWQGNDAGRGISTSGWLSIPDMSDAFVRKLYSTYLSYLPEDQFAYDLKMNVSERGSFTECLRSQDRGQVSVNISKPGITKGNHWHHTKNEKFLVVSGQGIIRFRRVDTSLEPFGRKQPKGQVRHNSDFATENFAENRDENQNGNHKIKAEDTIIEYRVSGERLQMVDIPPGYTHNITNTGTTDMVTLMWANELFDRERQDTYYLEV